MVEDGALAPVIPLFGRPASAAPAGGEDRRTDAAPEVWHRTWTEPAAGRTGRVDDVESSTEASGPTAADDRGEIAAAGEAALLRKLRTRSLSVREARTVLVERDVDEASTEAVIERFLGHGYLDDEKLAEQLIHTAVERKGQGRMAVSRALSDRGIAREVIDAALAALPDDERERAVEFARAKVRSMRGLDRDVALRRLSGQLARRGYGSYALDAARTAWDEFERPGRSSVRFEP